MRKIITSNEVNIDGNKISTVYITGNIVEVITPYLRNGNLTKFKKLNKTEYVDCDTGEVKEYKHTNNRSNNTQGIQRSLSNLRRIINLNFTGEDSERFLTLTYSTLMTDTDKLYTDFKNFICALRKRYPVEYIAIAEPQTSGSFHMHVLLKASSLKKLYITGETLGELWRHGFSHIEKLPFIENFGAYFGVRVTNLHLDEIIQKSSIPKSVLKGSRLHYYPKNFKLYRCSKGIKRPQAIQIPYKDAKKLTSAMEMCYSCSKQIISVDKEDNEKTLNTIYYEHYRYPKKKENWDMKNNQEKETATLLKKQTQLFNNLIDEFEMMFSVVKTELSKTCSLQTMRYMLMIDVFLNELKCVVFNYAKDEYADEM